MQIDFTNAFNRVNHKKLFRIMAALGFPSSLIALIRNVYSTSTTVIRHSTGPTPRMPVDHGTIQGDSLSPILFAIYIEPLLRWLHTGERGYRLQVEHDAELEVSNLTYADDLNCLSSTLHNTRVQAQKITAYAAWADLTINLAKSTVTAALHHTLKHIGSVSSPTGLAFTRQRLLGQVPLGGGTASYLSPLAPFPYLGIQFTILADWTAQKTKNVNAAKVICTSLLRSPIKPAFKLLTLDRLVLRKIAYSFPVCSYTNPELDDIDRILNRVVKQAYGLPRGMPTPFLRADKNSFGLNRPSIRSLYHHESAKHLVWATNHAGLISTVMKRLLPLQA